MTASTRWRCVNDRRAPTFFHPRARLGSDVPFLSADRFPRHSRRLTSSLHARPFFRLNDRLIRQSDPSTLPPLVRRIHTPCLSCLASPRKAKGTRFLRLCGTSHPPMEQNLAYPPGTVSIAREMECSGEAQSALSRRPRAAAAIPHSALALR